MSDLVYYIICGILTLGVLLGIAMLSKVKTAVYGNILSALSMAAAIITTIIRYEIFRDTGLFTALAAALVVTLILSLIWSYRIKMIEMPQVVALLNGLGGAASALVVLASISDRADVLTINTSSVGSGMGVFGSLTSGIAIAVGCITLSGSLIAAGKLHRLLNQRSVVIKHHELITAAFLFLTVGSIALLAIEFVPLFAAAGICIVSGLAFGALFAIRVGGADMPITISLLNSLSGVAGAIAGMAISDPLLVAVGGIVGASGLLLTQIMCKAMNRSLLAILIPKGAADTSSASKSNSAAEKNTASKSETAEPGPDAKPDSAPLDPVELLKNAKSVIIVPGYGMAVAQAQHLVKRLSDELENKNISVEYAIHPVAGHMPGHMNVLLAEADIPYEKLCEMDEINPKFADCDLAVIIGANDVVNPAANVAEDTPIYGMPVLNAELAKNILICNYDLNPGYSGVENPLYKRPNTAFLLGNAADTLKELIKKAFD